MSLRVIWQYMDRSVTKKMLYEPKKLRSIYYFFGDGPVHILPYDPQCHELFAIYIHIIVDLICENGFRRIISHRKANINRTDSDIY